LHAARARTGGSSGDDASIPIEPLDGVSALSGFTIGAAYACHQEDRRGRLLPGYGCDMTVLTVDPTSCDPEALLKARVLATVVNAEMVWSAK
jgi:predicted amidohydrolase YtcJ